MRTILNVIWFILGGFWLAVGYFLIGVLSCIPIITIPIGIAFIRMASYVIWPFGKEVVRKPNYCAFHTVINVIWFLIFGWALAVLHLLTALGQAITLVGITNAVVCLKLIPVSCFPFGKKVVTK